MLHQTVIVAVAYVVVGRDLAVWQKFTTVGLAALVLTLLLYEVVVRRTNATRFLLGMKPRRPEPSPTTPVLALPEATNDLPIAPASTGSRPSRW